MRGWTASAGLTLLAATSALAGDRPVVCFGNEPSWSVVLEGPSTARLVLPDRPPADFVGAEARLDPIHERVWRGAVAAGGGADLVVFLRDGDCSDGMSDTTHPVVARVSLPDGRFLAGCCRLPAAAAPGASIEGTEWRLVRLRGRTDGSLGSLPTPVTVRFEEGRMRAFAGCNQLTAGYSLDGDRLRSGTLAGTMMACPPPAMEIEREFAAALGGELRFRIEGERLTLERPGESEPALVFTAAPPPRLVGIPWEITGFNNGRHAVVSPLAGTSLQVTFAADHLTGYAGCNTFRAPWKGDADRLEVGPVASTGEKCPGEGVMQQEREFLAAIGSATVWAIDRGMLDVHRVDGERVLTAQPAAR